MPRQVVLAGAVPAAVERVAHRPDRVVDPAPVDLAAAALGVAVVALAGRRGGRGAVVGGRAVVAAAGARLGEQAAHRALDGLHDPRPGRDDARADRTHHHGHRDQDADVLQRRGAAFPSEAAPPDGPTGRGGLWHARACSCRARPGWAPGPGRGPVGGPTPSRDAARAGHRTVTGPRGWCGWPSRGGPERISGSRCRTPPAGRPGRNRRRRTGSPGRRSRASRTSRPSPPRSARP